MGAGASDAIEAVRADSLTPALLYQRHFSDVCRWVAHLAGPGPEVEDLVQDVFIIAMRRLDTFRGDAKITTWLYGISRNVVRNHRRKQKVRKLLGGGNTWDVDALPAPNPTQEEEVTRAERERLVYRVLDGMKEKYRTVLVLFELEGLDGNEIGERLNVKPATVFVQLHRARKQFLQRLQQIEGRR